MVVLLKDNGRKKIALGVCFLVVAVASLMIFFQNLNPYAGTTGSEVKVIGYFDVVIESLSEDSSAGIKDGQTHYMLLDLNDGRSYNLLFDQEFEQPRQFSAWKCIQVEGSLYKGDVSNFISKIEVPSKPIIQVSSVSRINNLRQCMEDVRSLGEGGDLNYHINSIVPPGIGVSVDSRSVVMLMVDFSDRSSVLDAAKWEDIMWNDNPSIDSIFDASSFGRVRFSESNSVAVGPFTISASVSDVCNPIAWKADVDASAVSVGIDLSVYDHRVYAFPEGINCPWTAKSIIDCIGKTECYIYTTTLTASYILHEFGHNFGLNNANDVILGEGYDYSCAMGASSASSWAMRQFNVPHTHALNWITSQHVIEAADVMTTDSFQEFTIDALELDTPDHPFAYRWPASVGERWNYLSYRAPLKGDVNIKSDYVDVLNIHSMDFNAYTLYYTGLSDGNSWIGPNGDNTTYMVEMDSHDATTATFRLRGCFMDHSLEIIDPIGPQCVSPGSSIQYTVRVTSNDSPGCPASRPFSIDSNVQTCLKTNFVSPASVEIPRGETEKFTIEFGSNPNPICYSKSYSNFWINPVSSPALVTDLFRAQKFYIAIKSGSGSCPPTPTPTPSPTATASPSPTLSPSSSPSASPSWIPSPSPTSSPIPVNPDDSFLHIGLTKTEEILAASGAGLLVIFVPFIFCISKYRKSRRIKNAGPAIPGGAHSGKNREHGMSLIKTSRGEGITKPSTSFSGPPVPLMNRTINPEDVDFEVNVDDLVVATNTSADKTDKKEDNSVNIIAATVASVYGESVRVPMGKPGVASWDFSPENLDEIELVRGQELRILGMPEEGWFEVVLPNGTRGIAPVNRIQETAGVPIQPLAPPSSRGSAPPLPSNRTRRKLRTQQ